MARRNRRPRARGWYEKDGDPPGTERFWDGEKWGPNPRQKRGAETKETKTTPRKAAAKVAPAADAATDSDGALNQASVWARISARSADMIIVVLPWYWLLNQAFTTEIVEGAEGPTEVVNTDVTFLWIAAAIVIIYEVAFVTMWGATPGKRLFGLVVLDRELQRPTFGRAVMRAVPLIVLGTVLLAPVLWVLCVVAMFVDKLQRSIFDFSAGTVVVLDPERPGRLAAPRN